MCDPSITVRRAAETDLVPLAALVRENNGHLSQTDYADAVAHLYLLARALGLPSRSETVRFLIEWATRSP